MEINLKAYAKLNLTLDVMSPEGGYHPIDSVVCSIDLYDDVTITAREDDLITCRTSGCQSEKIPYESNNAVKAAKAFMAKYSTTGVDIVIQKNIPVGAGLGGSSADCAGVLIGMSKLFCIDDYVGIKDIADSLGSDTGYMLKGGFARLRGRGQYITPVRSKLLPYFLLLVDDKGVDTAACYRLYDVHPVRDYMSQDCKTALESGNIKGVYASLSNALTNAASVINHSVNYNTLILKALGAEGVNMTGSGSCVYAMSDSLEQLESIQSDYIRDCGKSKTIICRAINPKYI